MLLRSVVAPLVLVATVVATFLASVGASWWIFTKVLGFSALDDSAPLFAFVFLVALGVDYNIFLVTRAREESRRHGSRQGMLRGLAATGGVITSAGILLAAVFAVLGVLPLVVLAQIGVIICVGVLLDTLVVRTLLVPAIAVVLGDRFWWPRRAHPAPANSAGIGVTDASPEARRRRWPKVAQALDRGRSRTLTLAHRGPFVPRPMSTPSVRLAAGHAPNSLPARGPTSSATAQRPPRRAPCRASTGLPRLAGPDPEGAHHLVVLVLQDVAVPDELAGTLEVRPNARHLAGVGRDGVLESGLPRLRRRRDSDDLDGLDDVAAVDQEPLPVHDFERHLVDMDRVGVPVVL